MTKEKCIRIYADQVQIDACREKITENETQLEQLTRILSLAANDVRLKILFLLEEESKLCPCDLADILNMTVPAVSQHLRKLKDGNIIQAIRKGQTIFYSLREEHLEILKPFFKHIIKESKKGTVS